VLRRRHAMSLVAASLTASAIACGGSAGSPFVLPTKQPVQPTVLAQPSVVAQPTAAAVLAAAATNTTTGGRGPSVSAQPAASATATGASVVTRSGGTALPAVSKLQAAAGALDACRLVTQAEAEGSAGEALGPGRSEGDARGISASCAYEN